MKLRNLLLTAGAGAAFAARALKMRRDEAEAALDRAWRALEGLRGSEPFSEEAVAHLPEPARRYLLHAIAPGTPVAPGMRLSMQGSIRLGGRWLPMRAEQLLAPPVGFVWRPQMDLGPLGFSGADSWFEGEGRVQFWTLGIIPVANQAGPDISRAAAGRLAIETLWAPTTLLGPGVRWESAGEDTARFTLDVGGDPMTVTLELAKDGALRATSMLRWGHPENRGRFEPVPFGGEVEEERSFGGYTLPSRVRVGWGFGTPRFDASFHAVLTRAEPLEEPG